MTNSRIVQSLHCLLVTLSGTSLIHAPSPILLEAHAGVARILHTRAMDTRTAKVLQHQEEIRCLATDGTTDVQSLRLVS